MQVNLQSRDEGMARMRNVLEAGRKEINHVVFVWWWRKIFTSFLWVVAGVEDQGRRCWRRHSGGVGFEFAKGLEDHVGADVPTGVVYDVLIGCRHVGDFISDGVEIIDGFDEVEGTNFVSNSGGITDPPILRTEMCRSSRA